MNKKSIPNDNPMVRAHFYTLLTGVCALCEADSPDFGMSGLFCVTLFRTRECLLCDACAPIPAHFAAETLKATASCDYEAHHALAKHAATEGAVLLKTRAAFCRCSRAQKSPSLEPWRRICAIRAQAPATSIPQSCHSLWAFCRVPSMPPAQRAITRRI